MLRGYVRMTVYVKGVCQMMVYVKGVCQGDGVC